MSYEPVPDVEQGDQGLLLPSSDQLIKVARERYPEAGTEIEAEFLGRLDDAMENAKPKVSVPRLTVQQLASGNASLEDIITFVKSLKLPTLALIVSLLTGALTVLSNSLLLQALFPYYTCILTFAASVQDA